MRSRIKTRELTHIALLVAIAVIASRLNVDNPLLGSSSRFGFSFVIFLSGLWFGPWKGGMTGVVSNLLAFILFDVATGPFHMGFVLNAFLAGFIPGLYFEWLRKRSVKTDFTVFSMGLLLLISTVSAGYVWNQAYKAVMKLTIIVGIAVLSLAMIVLLWNNRKRQDKASGTVVSIDKFLFISFIYKLVNSVLLAPLWLSQLYGRSYAFYFPIRLAKFPIEVLLVALVTYLVSRKIPRVMD
jgi:ECF transporter S component (folate family)